MIDTNVGPSQGSKDEMNEATRVVFEQLGELSSASGGGGGGETGSNTPLGGTSGDEEELGRKGAGTGIHPLANEVLGFD